MALPTFTPISNTPRHILPSTGTFSDVNSITVPLGVYLNDTAFITGAVSQVMYVYKFLGGDVVDIELSTSQVYTAYEEAVLEYSRIINLHQAKNVLFDLLGFSTGTFDHVGQFQSGSALSGTNPQLTFPKFSFAYAQRVSDGIATLSGFGGNTPIFSASFDLRPDIQDYDLQAAVSSSATVSGSSELFAQIYTTSLSKRIRVQKVYYKMPHSIWRLYGYYGYANVYGDGHYYGQYSDSYTFQLIPTWEHKLQAMSFEDSLYTRASHYSYEIKNNKIRIFPKPTTVFTVNKMWFDFYFDNNESFNEPTEDGVHNIYGVNNLNSIPFVNIPYSKINAIGKSWIRNYALALCKEMLAQIRGKILSIPIPGNSVTLNYAELATQAKEEKDYLRTSLQTELDQMVYSELSKKTSGMIDDVVNIQSKTFKTIYQG